MINYLVVNEIRGFLVESFNAINNTGEINITYKLSNSFEKVNKYKKQMHRIIMSPVFDWLGAFRVVKENGNLDGYDGLISYNRFVDTNKPYFIVMENPYGLMHYADRRMNYYLGKKKLKRCFENNNLKGIICLSQACYSSFCKIYDIPENLRITQGYPILPDGELEKQYDGIIHCLFIASDFYLKGGNEVIDAFGRIIGDGIQSVTLTIIAPFEKLNEKTIYDIKKLGIELKDYKLTKEEIKEEYKKAHILLNPTKMDSFSLVTLESMKYGCAYIGTDIYAIPEMVVHSETGYMTSSKYSPWDKDNLFIHKKHMALREQEKDKGVDDELASFVYEKIRYLHGNQGVLKAMNEKTFKRGNGEIFSMNSCCQKWLDVLNG